jgi:lysophospholipid acyltransferase (LPLAT)-like uncharacterized protein
MTPRSRRRPLHKRTRRRRRPLHKRARRRLKRGLSLLLTGLAPPLYRAYLGLVWRTSRVVLHGVEEGKQRLPEGAGFAALFWHEEVVVAPYVYRKLGYRAHALIARGGPGDVATAVARGMGHAVTRGGTSRRGSRHRPLALRNLIRDLQADPGGILAVLVDGPSGPRYRMKPGAVLVARECGLPVALLRVWCQRTLRLGSWDRAAVPLPWGTIHVYAEGPFDVPEDASTRPGLNRFRRELEWKLLKLAERSLHDVHQEIPEKLARRLEQTRSGEPFESTMSESG